MSDPSQIPNLPKPPRPWITLLVGGVLVLSGMVMGAGGTGLLVKNRLDQPDQAPSHFSRRLSERMTRDLDLTSEQESQIQQIFETHQKGLHAVRQSVEQRVNDSFSTMQSEVKAILTPEQAKVWSERVRRYNSRGERDRPTGREPDRRMRHQSPEDRPLMRDGERRPPHFERSGGEPRPREQFGDPDERPRDNTQERYEPNRRPDDRPDSHRPPPPPPQ
ncbi:MAG TPA: hypothetical protein EYN96_12365 [Candidatus Hydrogenedentes bacterium]|nr:hypothetical protein [Candidatus Hydrogenedentota bacterium]